jgi:hypothetical protein
MFNMDPSFFHPGSRVRIKEFKYFYHKKWFLSSGCSSLIRILTFYPSRIWIHGQKGTGSRIRNTDNKTVTAIVMSHIHNHG